jgi:hypothetical protein
MTGPRGVSKGKEFVTGAYANVCVQVGLWVFGENFPAASDPPAEQVFSLLTAGLGLAAFALILALVEQVLPCTAHEWVTRLGPEGLVSGSQHRMPTCAHLQSV